MAARTLTLLSALLGCAVLVYGQSPDDLTFRLSTTRNPPIYHMGERIELELSFSSQTPGKYLITNTSESRDNSLLPESYTVSPAAGAFDPRENMFYTFAGGSFLSSEQILTANPVIRHAELNEWVHFRKPGEYQIRAESQRISSADRKSFPAEPDSKVMVQSNTIDLAILPSDSVWTANELNDIQQILGSTISTEKKIAVARRLRFLDTPESVPLLVAEYLKSEGAVYQWELQQGILQSSSQAIIIPILEATLRDPQGSASYDLVYTLAQLRINQEYKNSSLPLHDEKTPESVKAVQRAEDQRVNRFTELVTNYMAVLAQTLPCRSGKSRAKALFILWDQAESRRPSDDSPVSPELAQLRAELVSLAVELDPSELMGMLNGFGWNRLPHSPLLPLLPSIVTRAAPVGSAVDDLRTIASERWCETDAPDCQRTLVAEILKPQLHLQFPALLAMPKASHPELSRTLEQRLEDPSNLDETAALIDRYGSSDLTARVRQFLMQSGKVWACRPQAHLIAYLLRVDQPEGIRLASAALARRGPESGCYQSLLMDLGDLNYVPKLSELAIHHLQRDPSPEVAGNAATLLAKYGPPSAEAFIWQRFERWSAKWHDYADQLQPTPGRPNNFEGERWLQNNLYLALGQAQAWKLSRSDYDRLSTLCVTDECRSQVSYLVNALK